MPLFSLEAGLVVRRGSRTLEFVRLLEGNKVQFQDQLTRQVQTLHLNRFYQAVLAQQIVPVLAEEPMGADITTKNTKPVFVTDMSSLKPKDKSTLGRRMKYVKALRKLGITRGQRDRVVQALPKIAQKFRDASPPSASTVMDWMRKYETSSCNPAALLSGNRNRRRETRLHPQMRDLALQKISSVYLTMARHTLRHTLDKIRQQAAVLVRKKLVPAAEATVSMATVQRLVKSLDPYEVDKRRYGINYARAQYRTSVEGTQAIRSLQRLECDHTLLNWVVLCDRTGLPLGRPTLTIVIDSYSGYPVGIYVSFYGPGLTSVLNVMKNAILPKDDITKAAGTKRPWIAFGIGETLLLDNGLEFHSPQFQLAAWDLGIDIEYCRVRMPWLKPKVERFFLNLDFLSLKHGRIFKPKEHVLRLDPNKDAAITFSDFLTGLIRFVVDIYPFEQNSRTLDLPFERYQAGIEELPPPVFPHSFQQLDMIAAMSRRLTVSSGGVGLLDIPYSSPDLHALKKRIGATFKTLVKWNPNDLSYVYVQNPRDELWLTVPSLWVEYTADLSWVQHQITRNHKRAQHVQGGTEEALLQSRLELHDIWMNPLGRRNRSADMRTAAKYEGMSSARFAAGDQPVPPRRAAEVIAPEEVHVVQEAEIPDFESFDMN